MKLFKSKEEKTKEISRKIYEKEFDERLSKVRFFPGSVVEYETFVGYKVRIIDIGIRDIGVLFGRTNEDIEYECYERFDRKKVLVEQGIEALVNCNYTLGGNNMRFYHRLYGLPVRKE